MYLGQICKNLRNQKGGKYFFIVAAAKSRQSQTFRIKDHSSALNARCDVIHWLQILYNSVKYSNDNPGTLLDL